VDLQAFAVAAALSDQFFDTLSSMFGSYGVTAVAVAKIIGINIILSGDNAVVIALACRSLPPRQRMLGILLGAGAAVILRIIFTVIVNQLLGIHYLKLAGGLLLFWIAVKLLIQDEADEESVRGGSSVWEAVKIVAIADIVMSLDNVLAIAAAAGGDTFLIIFGLIISIPLVIGGATLITNLLTRYPVLVWAGAALLGWVAGELLATEPALMPAVETLAQTLGVSTKTIARGFEVIGALVVIGVGRILVRKAAAKEGARRAAHAHADER
jgi:YjbE family integral membrane protein